MQHKDTIVKNTCLDYVVEHLPKEFDKYYRICESEDVNYKQVYSSRESLQWYLIMHLICVFKTLVTFDTELQEEYKELFEMINKFEKEN